VHVSVMGDDTQQKLSLRGLQSAAGFLQSKIAEQIDTRYTPRLLFILDQGVKKSIEMAQLLKQVLPPETEEPATADEEAKAETDAEAESDDFPNDEENTQPRRPR
jgi:ribosome-binding factor A